MLKTPSCKLALLAGALSCFMSMAHAEVDTSSIAIKFVGDTQFGDFTCGVKNQQVVYTLQNLTPATIDIYNVYVRKLDTSTTTIKVTTQHTTGMQSCLTDVTNNVGEGSLPPAHTTGYICQIILSVTTPDCSSGPIINEEIDRILHINIDDTQQEKLTKPLIANITVLGSGRDFAVLDTANAPVNASPPSNELGDSQLVGDLGIVPNSDGFQVKNGAVHTTDDPTVITANKNFTNGYDAIMAVINAGCTTHNNISGTVTIPAAYYCLSQPFMSGYTDIDVSGNITLSGNTNIVFAIDPSKDCGGRMCDMYIHNISFTYINGASPANVYWVSPKTAAGLGGDIYIEPGTTLAGSVLTDLSDIIVHPTGRLAADVCGSLWSKNGNISLAGTTVNSEAEDFCETPANVE